MRKGKLILLNDGLINVRDENKKELSFRSLEDFKRYASDFIGTTFDGVEYYLYQPDDEYHFYYNTNDDTEHVKPFPDAALENIISNYDVIKARKADPLYGLSGQDLTDAQERIAKAEALAARVAAFKAEVESDGTKTITMEQVDNYLDNQYDNTDLAAAIQVMQNAATALEVRDALIPVFQEIAKLSLKSKAVDRRIIVALLEVIASTD